MARPIWTGSINFGLVSIPVEMNMAVHERTVHFHMLTKDGTCRLRRKLVCPDTGKEYDFSQTAKGIEIGPEDYVLVDQREIDRLKPEKGRSMEIVQFVEPAAIDPVYYDHVYYLKPGKDAKKAYKLLVAAMKDSGKYALGRFVMRERQYMAMIRIVGEGMVLHTLHYADEIDDMDGEITSAMERIKISTPELRMATQLIKSMTRELHMEQFKDEFREQLHALIDAKAHGKEITRAPEPEQQPVGRTVNLMDALKRSLAGDHNNGRDGHNGRHPRGKRARHPRSVRVAHR
jgi:DNA end-binding protein Ku